MLQKAIDNPDGTTKYPIVATVMKIGEVKFHPTRGTASQQIILNDGQSEEKVKIFQSSNPALTETHLHKRLQFNVGGYISTHDQKTYLSGFWQPTAQAGQGQPSQPAQQQAERPAASPEAKPAQQTGKDPNSRGEVRHGVVCAFIQNGKQPKIEDIEYWVDYIMTGRNAESTGNPNDEIDF